MANDLKTALLNAGFVPSPEKKRPPQKRPFTPQNNNSPNNNNHQNNQSHKQQVKVLPKAIEKKVVVPLSEEQQHQIIVTICAHCSGGYPDIEYYNHQHRLLTAKWLCCRCADEFMIDDIYRTTAQSEYSKKGIFRRQFGRTMRIKK